MKISGTVEDIREIERTVEVARTKGDILIGKEVKRGQFIQGKDYESAAFGRMYEIYLDKSIKDWETSSHSFLSLIASSTIKIRFWYEYRTEDMRKGTGYMDINKSKISTLCKAIPDFGSAIRRNNSVYKREETEPKKEHEQHEENSPEIPKVHSKAF